MQSADWLRTKNKFSLLPHSVFLKSKSGFTLIEMLVVMAIIGILTGGAITAYNNFNQGQTVRRAALDLVSDIRETQSRAVSGLKNPSCSIDFFPSGLPPGDNIDDYKLDGHYLVFRAGPTSYSYQRQQSCSEDTDSDQSASPSTIKIPPDPGELINLVGNNSVFIDRVDLSGLCLPLTDLTVNFLPLRGVEFWYGIGLEAPSTPANPSCQSADIVISDGITYFTITVNLSGQVIQTKTSP